VSLPVPHLLPEQLDGARNCARASDHRGERRALEPIEEPRPRHRSGPVVFVVTGVVSVVLNLPTPAPRPKAQPIASLPGAQALSQWERDQYLTISGCFAEQRDRF